VRPELAGVVFEQIPPKAPPPDFFQPPSHEQYTLRAYADGQRFSVKARNSHSLEDLGAVLGLLNQVLESRGSPHRFAVLDSQVTEVEVVFGPDAALREADTRGLWRLGDGSQVAAKAEALIETNIRRILGEIPF
jgi:Ser/Thr protein kinase RdoA (MazF antagonist)